MGWMVIGQKWPKYQAKGEWARGLRATFAEATTLYDEIMDTERFRDASIVSRGVVYPWPHEDVWDVSERSWSKRAKYSWAPDPHSWCGRCRRPTVYRMCPDGHPALRGFPVITPNVRRCHFCGLQEGFQTTWTR